MASSYAYCVLTVSIRKLAQLQRSLKKFHITQDEVAAAVLPRPVHRTQVNHVLHGRVVSRRVLEAAARLIAARQAAAAGPARGTQGAA